MSWLDAPPPPLTPEDVHVWLAALDEWTTALDECRRVLSADEHSRAERFRSAQLRDRYQIGRGILRHLLAFYLERQPDRISFAYGEHGKPELAGADSTIQRFNDLTPAHSQPLRFNISHSGDRAVFAFTRAGSVGVDIEGVRTTMLRQMEIAERHFAPGEVACLRNIPESDRAAAFFRCWARKEAVIKARGDGVFGGLQNFEVTVEPGSARLLAMAGDATAGERWSMEDLPHVPGFAGAVAVAAPHCRFWHGRISPRSSAWRKVGN